MPELNSNASSPLRRWRRAVGLLWIAATASGLCYYSTHAPQFTPQHLAEDFRNWQGLMLWVYLAASISRALVLIPSTPFVLAGCLLFPDQPLMVLAVSLVAIAISASLLYFGSEVVGLDSYFRERHPQRFARLETALNSRWGFWALVAWAGFPLAPTDLACCVAGTMRLPFWRFLAAVCLGELIVCASYIFLGQAIQGTVVTLKPVTMAPRSLTTPGLDTLVNSAELVSHL